MLIHDAKLHYFESLVKHFEYVYNEMVGFRYKMAGICYFLNIALQWGQLSINSN